MFHRNYGIKRPNQRRYIYRYSCEECNIETRKSTRREVYSLKQGKELINTHLKEKPLHKPKLFQTREYLAKSGRHFLRYRGDENYPHIYSVDGFYISGDKCAWECVKCGAIWESKAINCRSIFETDDPRCIRCG
jgi:hypothetical protein